MKLPDIIAGVTGFVISTYVLITAYHFPEDKVLVLGPHFFPMLLAVGLGALSLGLIFLAVLGKSRPAKAPFSLKDPGVQRSGIALLAIIIYCFVFERLGFIITSAIFLFFLMYLLKRRDYAKMAAISVGVSLMVYGIFNRLLDISLPAGLLG